MNDLSWAEKVRRVHQRTNFRCEYCQTSQFATGQAMHVEHIIPDGGDGLSNLCLACPTCNLSKARATSALDPETEELMQSGNRYTIEPYRKYLEPRFPEAVSLIYERHLKTLLVEKVNRKGYQEACRYLRRIDKLGQVEFAQKIVQELRGQYPNRRALMVN